MKHIFDQQTATDLEFDVIRSLLEELCHSTAAKERMSDLLPLRKYDEAVEALDQASELLQIRDNLGSFPRLEFDELHLEIQRLGIAGGVVDLEGFVRLLDASNLMNDILQFLKGEEELFPKLHALANQAHYTTGIVKPINKVLDQRLQVRDSASSELQRIRSAIGTTRRDVSKNFDKVLRKLHRDGYLADTKEAYINDRRVLSVVSSHKRQVAGNVVGNSKSGSFTYIEPHENMGLNNELEMLLDDERAEIRRIFLALTDEIRQLLPLIGIYQSALIEFDFINAKVRLAQKMDGQRPAIENESFLELINAYHPLLLLSNKNEGLKTIPQSLYLDKFCRMMVISGPNAGGKSITLKTVGLLQIMIQSGLLVPADVSSKFGWFHNVLSDIGDNQSIANQLSTYSYRLKRMKLFLEVSNKRSLLLLDEFGTGSDPDLGGALAEVFFETIYNRRSFGIITTHYANIKLKAARMRNAQNASMLFDSESLEPLYQLSVGQPGSSFTFEVAQINGIPQEIIEEAKTRLDANKVEMDNLIATLQKEKSEIEQLNRSSKQAEASALEAKEESDLLSEHYAERLHRQQQLIEKNNKDLSNGKKMGLFIQSYRMKGQNKPLLEELRKFLAIEKSKLVKKKEQAKVRSEEDISIPKPRPKKKNEEPKAPPKPVNIGCTVRMMNGSNKGEVIEIKGKEATVMFGIFKTKVKASELEVV